MERMKEFEEHFHQHEELNLSYIDEEEARKANISSEFLVQS